jgi:hypothetical protein
MPQNANDAMWDPRPRLEREAEHVDGGDSPEQRADNEPAAPPEGTGADNDAVLVELASAPGMSQVAALEVGRSLERPGFRLDEGFGATPLGGDPDSQTFVVRGHVSDDVVIRELESDPRVVKVWRDTKIAPF